jgi:hypothetical protein
MEEIDGSWYEKEMPHERMCQARKNHIYSTRDGDRHMLSMPIALANGHQAQSGTTSREVTMEEIDGKLYEYLGDGVYACHDGFGIWLHANDHRAEFATDKIYLEPTVLDALNRFCEKLKEAAS